MPTITTHAYRKTASNSISASALVLALLLAGCGGSAVAPDPNPTPRDMKQGPGLLSGESGNLLDAFRSEGGSFGWGDGEGGSGGKLGVNGFLWRASLETMNFLPLTSADSTGGVIITDWRVSPTNTAERVKATVYIFGKQLTAQAVQVTLYKQQLESGVWVDTPADTATARKLEEAILTKARSLKVSSQQQR